MRLKERERFRGEREGAGEREVRGDEELVNIREVIREEAREVREDNKEESEFRG